MKRNGGTLDLDYYLNSQIHPPVMRLLVSRPHPQDPFPETDGVRVAELLGIDPTQYRRAAAATEVHNPRAPGLCSLNCSRYARFEIQVC